jgi:hypothetical protein
MIFLFRIEIFGGLARYDVYFNPGIFVKVPSASRNR